MSRGILYIMSGPSGTGKGTVCAELVKRADIYLSVSATSREMRKGETQGVTYHYVTPEEFKNLIDNDKMLEWAVYSENYYGTPKEEIEKNLNAGRDVILEIEPQGAMQVKAKMPDAVLLFIVPPSMQVLRKRLEDRGREDTEEIEKRINAAKWEFSQAEKYNNVIVNDDLDECVLNVLKLMDSYKKERQIIENLLNE